MQPAAVSYLKTYDDPLYPYQVKVATPLQDCKVDATLSELDLAHAESNAETIHRTLATGNVVGNIKTLAAICQIAQQLTVHAPTVIRPNDEVKLEIKELTKSLETSIMLLPCGEGKRVHVVRKGAHIHKRQNVKITKAFMLTFDKSNQLLGVKHVVRLLLRKNPKQLHCMQLMDARPDLFPENLDYVEYKPDCVAIFQERAGGDLLNYHNETERFPTVSNGLQLASQLVEAVRYMHERNIAHRDLKLDNLLVFGKAKALASIKISDFGYAIRVEDTEANKERVGTFTWAAPELRYKGNDPIDQIAIDIWSLGHILYVFLEGEPAPIYVLFAKEYDLQKQIEKNREAFDKLVALEAEKKKLISHIDAKLSESNPLGVSSKERPSHVVKREVARIFLILQSVLRLLQTSVQPELEKQTIVKQLDTRWALVTALFEARRLIHKAGLLAHDVKSTTSSPGDSSSIVNQLMTSIQMAQNESLELYIEKINLQLEEVARFIACSPISEKNLQSELVEVEEANLLLQEQLKAAYQASKSYLVAIHAKPQEKVRSLKDAVLAMLRVDPKSRLDLATVHRFLKDEIKLRNETIELLTPQRAFVSIAPSEPPKAASESFLTALFSKVFGACIGGNRS